MATLREYFEVDFANALAIGFSWSINETEANISVKVGIDIYSSAKFIAYYVSSNPRHFDICRELITGGVSEAIKKSNDLSIQMGFGSDRNLGAVGTAHSVFANRVYIYAEDEFNEAEAVQLDELCKGRQIWLTVRGASYVAEKMRLESPMAFISHDSRDKADVATHIAVGLQKLMCPVWFDEFSLKVGDHLRESIERGLREARKCVLILSHNFLSNTGWTKTEFNSVFTRELLERSSVVLPIWYNVTVKDIYQYSPSLADRVGLDWTKLGQEEVVRRLYHAITTKQ